MKDYAKIAEYARMQKKIAEEQTIRALIQGAVPEICDKAIQDAERTAQAGGTHFPLEVYNFTDGLYGKCRKKAFRTLYRAVQKELRQRNLYLLEGRIYFRRSTFFGPLCLVVVTVLLLGLSALSTFIFNFWVGIVSTGVMCVAVGGAITSVEDRYE